LTLKCQLRVIITEIAVRAERSFGASLLSLALYELRDRGCCRSIGFHGTGRTKALMKPILL
jgi:hypothetical protein